MITQMQKSQAENLPTAFFFFLLLFFAPFLYHFFLSPNIERVILIFTRLRLTIILTSNIVYPSLKDDSRATTNPLR